MTLDDVDGLCNDVGLTGEVVLWLAICRILIKKNSLKPILSQLSLKV